MSERQKLLNEIITAAYKYPELQLCDILSAAANKTDWGNNDLRYLEDWQLIIGLERLNNL